MSFSPQASFSFSETLASEPSEPFDFTAKSVSSPAAYDGLLAFHKYWGKKPVEPLAFIIERVTRPGDLVVDPFSGSGVTGFASVGLNRRYLGIDINPIAVKLSSFVLSPLNVRGLRLAFSQLSSRVKTDIDESYRTSEHSAPATHYLWNGNQLQEIWVVAGRRRAATFAPSRIDQETFEKYETYQPQFRSPRFFKNSRINADPLLTWHDLFTGRALRNIELLLKAIHEFPEETRSALELCLTASVGQMSKMVFAITGRGKRSGQQSDRIEVGSRVIGFWRPPLHFEINAWNCLERKADKLISGVSSLCGKAKSGTLEQLTKRVADFSIINGNATEVLSRLEDESVDLILTDPPHSDRAPYLELSELWNAVLGLDPKFDDEIVVSRACY